LLEAGPSLAGPTSRPRRASRPSRAHVAPCLFHTSPLVTLVARGSEPSPDSSALGCRLAEIVNFPRSVDRRDGDLPPNVTTGWRMRLLAVRLDSIRPTMCRVNRLRIAPALLSVALIMGSGCAARIDGKAPGPSSAHGSLAAPPAAAGAPVLRLTGSGVADLAPGPDSIWYVRDDGTDGWLGRVDRPVRLRRGCSPAFPAKWSPGERYPTGGWSRQPRLRHSA
jgi:hypothetical protein